MFDYAAGQGMAILNAAPFAGGVLAKGASTMPKIKVASSAKHCSPTRISHWRLALGRACCLFFARELGAGVGLEGVFISIYAVEISPKWRHNRMVAQHEPANCRNVGAYLGR